MKKIGIIGGGQLGMMICEAARELGAQTVVLDPSTEAPAFKVADEAIVGCFDDEAALEELCRRSDVVTYEFENVPGHLLVELEQKYNIKQGFKPLFDSQDRLREKQNANAHGLRTAKFIDVTDEDGLRWGVSQLGYPCIYKTRTLGYDGHGQVIIRSAEDIDKVTPYLIGSGILEEFVPFDYEVSTVLVSDGEHVICFPVGQNIHRDGILDLSVVPAPKMSDAMCRKIEERSKSFMLDCGYKGILTIEYFVKGDEFYFNEMAPRPHNSGHYTIEGCQTSQFKELCRFLLGQELQQPQLVAPTVMKNILGQDLETAKTIARQSPESCYVHIYGKRDSKPKRKMAHITYVGMTREEFESQWSGRFV